MSISPAIRDNYGNNPCLPPHLLGRLLDKLRERIGSERKVKSQHIDRSARQAK